MTTPISLGGYISCLYRYSQAWLEKQLQPLGMTAACFPFVMALLRQDDRRQEALSAELSIDKATTTRAIRCLMQAGLVERSQDMHDRRALRVRLTDRCRSLRPSLQAISQRWSALLTDGFSPTECQTALELLARMSANAVASRPAKSSPARIRGC